MDVPTERNISPAVSTDNFLQPAYDILTVKNGSFIKYAVKYEPNGSMRPDGVMRVSMVSLDNGYESPDLQKVTGGQGACYLVESFLPEGVPVHGDIHRTADIASSMLERLTVDAKRLGCSFVVFRENAKGIQDFLSENSFDRYVRQDDRSVVSTGLFYKGL